MHKSKLFNLIEERPLYFVLALFSLSVILKMFLCTSFQGPILFFDEYYYKENALYLTKFKYFIFHYPPLYSFFISPGFLFENYYWGFKFINIFLSSTLVFPVWLLSKEYLDNKKSIIVCIISLLLPFHFVYNKMVMSENLFYTITVFSVYFLIKFLHENEKKWALLLSASLFMCIITRYFAVIQIPIFIVIFLYDIVKNPSRTKGKLSKGLLSIGLFVALMAIFFIPNFDYFIKRQNDYVTKSVQENYLLNYIKWFTIYSLYSISLFLPLIYSIYSRIEDFASKGVEYKHKLLLLTAVIYTLFSIALASYHSCTGIFSTTYLNGRYILYVGIIWIIISFLPDREKAFSNKKLVFNLTIPILIVILAYLGLNGTLFNTADWLLIPHMSPEGYIFIDNFKILFISLLILSLFFIVDFLKKYKYTSVIVFHALIAFFSLNILNDPIGIHGNELNKCVKEKRNQTIYNGTPCFNYQFYHFLNFWGKYDFKVKPKPSTYQQCNENGYLISSNKISRNRAISKYKYNNTTYYIYKTPLRVFNGESKDLISNFPIAVVKNKTQRNDNPYGYNVSLIDSNRHIFMMNDVEFTIQSSYHKDKSNVLFCQFGFLPISKSWNVSDGMSFKVEYRDSLQDVVVFEQHVMPQDEDYEKEIALPKTNCSKYTLTFSTYGSGKNSDGDWGVWNDIEILYK